MKLWSLVGASVVAAAISLQADTVVLQNGLNGYTGCNDTYLVMTSDRAQGAKQNLIVEGYHCTLCIDQRALIRFDLSSLPSAADVTRAVLFVYSLNQPRPGAGQINVYRVTRQWTESVAAWMTAETGIKWTNQGGDFKSPRDTMYQYGTDTLVWHSVDITPMVRDFIAHPDQNFGTMLYMEPAMLTVQYASSNNADASLRPKLTLEGSALSAVLPSGSRASLRSALSVRLDGHRIVASNPGRISVIDLRGRKLIAGNGLSVDVSTIPAGFYFAGVDNGSTSVVQRVGIAR